MSSGAFAEHALSGAPPRAEGAAGTRVQVWVDLAMPPMALMTMPSSRAAYGQAVRASQDMLAASLRAHGAVELARLRMVRNSIAVDLPSDSVDAVRGLPGVLQVRLVTHRDRIDPPLPAQ